MLFGLSDESKPMISHRQNMLAFGLSMCLFNEHLMNTYCNTMFNGHLKNAYLNSCSINKRFN
jgi:hypothetical protein